MVANGKPFRIGSQYEPVLTCSCWFCWSILLFPSKLFRRVSSPLDAQRPATRSAFFPTSSSTWVATPRARSKRGSLTGPTWTRSWCLPRPARPGVWCATHARGVCAAALDELRTMARAGRLPPCIPPTGQPRPAEQRVRAPAPHAGGGPLPPPSRTNWTRLVPHPVLTGHAARRRRASHLRLRPARRQGRRRAGGTGRVTRRKIRSSP